MVDLNRATSITDEDLQDLFAHHPWSPEQTSNGIAVREAGAAFFKSVIENVPPCPDRTVALRKIRDARMDANSAITHAGKY